MSCWFFFLLAIVLLVVRFTDSVRAIIFLFACWFFLNNFHYVFFLNLIRSITRIYIGSKASCYFQIKWKIVYCGYIPPKTCHLSTMHSLIGHRLEYSWKIARWTLNTNQSINQLIGHFKLLEGLGLFQLFRTKPPTCLKSLTSFITSCCIEYTSPERKLLECSQESLTEIIKKTFFVIKRFVLTWLTFLYSSYFF